MDANGDEFEILANTAGKDSTLTLARLAADPERMPALERASILIAEAQSPYQDPGRPASWEARVAQVALTGTERYQVIVPPRVARSTSTPVTVGVGSIVGAPASVVNWVGGSE